MEITKRLNVVLSMLKFQYRTNSVSMAKPRDIEKIILRRLQHSSCRRGGTVKKQQHTNSLNLMSVTWEHGKIIGLQFSRWRENWEKHWYSAHTETPLLCYKTGGPFPFAGNFTTVVCVKPGAKISAYTVLTVLTTDKVRNLQFKSMFTISETTRSYINKNKSLGLALNRKSCSWIA